MGMLRRSCGPVTDLSRPDLETEQVYLETTHSVFVCLVLLWGMCVCFSYRLEE